MKISKLFVYTFVISLIILVLPICFIQAQENFQPGDVIILTIDYQNDGNGEVRTIRISGFIPEGTSYNANSLLLGNVPQTDILDDDQGYVADDQSAVYFIISSVPSGATGEISFQIKINEDADPNLEITNQATVTYETAEEENPVEENLEIIVPPEEETPPPVVAPPPEVPSPPVETPIAPAPETGTTSATDSSSGSVGSYKSTEEIISIETALPTETVTPDDKSAIELTTSIDEKPKIIEVVATAPMVKEVVQATKQTTKFYKEKIIANEPLRKTNQVVVVPVITTAVAVNTAVATIPLATSGWSIFQYLFQALQFLFTEPAIIFSKKKRQTWGVIYNSLNKQPISLAVVRLYQLLLNGQKRLIATKVTGSDGRYFFLVQPNAKYSLEVTAANFVFPTKHLLDKGKDEVYDRLYQGKEIQFTAEEKPLINFNIPLDSQSNKVYLASSSKATKSKVNNLFDYLKLSHQKLIKENKVLLRAFNRQRVASLISFLGPAFALLCLLISPGLLTGGIFIVHLIFLFVFKTLSKRMVAKPWGEVYAQENKRPLQRAIVRLFDKQYGKLLLTQITSGDGRYGFLIGDAQYVLTCEKENYLLPNKKLEIMGNKGGIIKRDLVMAKINK